LYLQRSDKVPSGYKGVTVGSGERRRPYNAAVRGTSLGCFESAEEAALVYARATRPVHLAAAGVAATTIADLAGAARALEGARG
jgi:hypothetical protein